MIKQPSGQTWPCTEESNIVGTHKKSPGILALPVLQPLQLEMEGGGDFMMVGAYTRQLLSPP